MKIQNKFKATFIARLGEYLQICSYHLRWTNDENNRIQGNEAKSDTI